MIIQKLRCFTYKLNPRKNNCLFSGEMDVSLLNVTLFFHGAYCIVACFFLLFLCSENIVWNGWKKISYLEIVSYSFRPFCNPKHSTVQRLQ